MVRPILQVALDLLELPRAVQIAKESMEGGADWIEVGTPLIKSEGMKAITLIRETFPRTTLVADMKVADTGTLEVEMAAKAGASVVCILADADDSVIREAVRAAKLYGVSLMADLINTAHPVVRAKELEELGVDYLCAHVGIDQQMMGMTSNELLARLRGVVQVPLAVAGGLDAETASEAITLGATIVIVGGWITRSANVTASTRRIRDAIDRPTPLQEPRESPDTQIRHLLDGTEASGEEWP